MRDGRKDEIIIQDVSGIIGTNCYLDKNAADEIRDRYKSVGRKAVHLLGSGNYHYLTYLWLEKICQDFSLLVFDNHPDMQKPAFGDVLSCGSWVLRSIEDFPNLKNVYICGASLEHIKEEAPYPENVHFIDNVSDCLDEKRIYLSIDKDVLGEDYAVTDWDQGNMSLSYLVSEISRLNGIDILGIDICGDTKTEPEGSGINFATNEELIPICLALLKGGSLS